MSKRLREVFKSALRNLQSAILLGTMLFALCFSVEAQQPKKVYRLGILSPAISPTPSLPTASNIVPKILAELGYVEGKNLVIYRRFAEGEGGSADPMTAGR